MVGAGNVFSLLVYLMRSYVLLSYKTDYADVVAADSLDMLHLIGTYGYNLRGYAQFW